MVMKDVCGVMKVLGKKKANEIVSDDVKKKRRDVMIKKFGEDILNGKKLVQKVKLKNP